MRTYPRYRFYCPNWFPVCACEGVIIKETRPYVHTYHIVSLYADESPKSSQKCKPCGLMLLLWMVVYSNSRDLTLTRRALQKGCRHRRRFPLGSKPRDPNLTTLIPRKMCDIRPARGIFCRGVGDWIYCSSTHYTTHPAHTFWWFSNRIENVETGWNPRDSRLGQASVFFSLFLFFSFFSFSPPLIYYYLPPAYLKRRG